MASKKVYYLAVFVGSILGGMVPTLWGAGYFSFSAVLFSGIGGVLAIVIVYKFL
jgi:predicted MFS family arabinose efflux permease